MRNYNQPYKALMLCGNCHYRFYAYLAGHFHHSLKNIECPRCGFYAASQIYQDELEPIETTVPFDSNGMSNDCPLITDGNPKLYETCYRECPYFIDSIGFEVYCGKKCKEADQENLKNINIRWKLCQTLPSILQNL